MIFMAAPDFSEPRQPVRCLFGAEHLCSSNGHSVLHFGSVISWRRHHGKAVSDRCWAISLFSVNPGEQPLVVRFHFFQRDAIAMLTPRSIRETNRRFLDDAIQAAF